MHHKSPIWDPKSKLRILDTPLQRTYFLSVMLSGLNSLFHWYFDVLHGCRAVSALCTAELSRSLEVVVQNLTQRVTSLEARLDSLKTNSSRIIRQVSALDVPVLSLTRSSSPTRFHSRISGHDGCTRLQHGIRAVLIRMNEWMIE